MGLQRVSLKLLLLKGENEEWLSNRAAHKNKFYGINC